MTSNDVVSFSFYPVRLYYPVDPLGYSPNCRCWLLRGNGCFLLHVAVIKSFLSAGHALGFFHEQSRPDRDDFVTVHLENVEPGMYNQVNQQLWYSFSEYHVKRD